MNDVTLPPSEKDIVPVTIEEEMRKSYLDYAMSVIVSRALPDARDGLKPVHRRIIYAMYENGYTSDKQFRKSARVVGDVMGRYHPHGDSAIYDAMVRLAQDFSMRLPLVEGQGNFGSMDGDKAAAMRYTEARLEKAAESLIDDIDKETVDFANNYDDSEQEPTVLPARYPNLLVNGAGGIAVGMATNIPPHNLGEVIDASVALLGKPEMGEEELLDYVPGPDFPTGGVILGRSGSISGLTTGRGSVIMRAKVEVEEIRKDRQALIVTEIPYQVNKSRLVEQIADLVRSKKVEGIGDLRDESDRHGVRVVIEIKRDAVAEIVLNQLYRYTSLQTSFGVNMLALNRGKPELMNLKELLEAFLDFREEVVTRRTKYLLRKARERAHVLIGLAIAVANIDEVIQLIRSAPDPLTARTELMSRAWPATSVESLIRLVDDPEYPINEDGTYHLSEFQARAILDLRLQRLTALGQNEIGDELKGLGERIVDYLDILSSRPRLIDIIQTELLEMKEKYATPRRTLIEENEFEHDIEDLIQQEDMVLTVSHKGYIKRVPLSTYRPQRRGGKGRSGMQTRDEDFVTQVFVVNTHTPVLFFSSFGRVYKMKVYRLPLGSPQSLGKAIINLLPLEEGEVISTLMPLPEEEDSWNELQVMFATANGNVRRNRLSDFSNVKSNGKIAMRLDDDDQLIGVGICTEQSDILLAAYGGKCIRFQSTDVRLFKGRDSSGVRGMRLASGDRVIGMSVLGHVDVETEEREAYLKARRSVDEDGNVTDYGDMTPERYQELFDLEEVLLSITENGYGKRTNAYEYRVTNRGGQGIINIETSKRNGQVVATFPVLPDNQIMLVTNGGKLIRTPIADIRIAGRNTQGVTLFKTAEGEKVVSVTALEDKSDDEHDEDDLENGLVETEATETTETTEVSSEIPDDGS
ncbi:DNA gyrase subunit A [Sneathiella chinensis]|uniref:DNA gyrase subunit A n=1 Tax=Sneathiella chinensis TaxID=349750 RepID=A0ABQ5UA66_9PROT|nr:DNA gyrase subunit A [Sneathiella chinensis]GLQ07436.1 DNA gyrase subunit A [Sneathiella chinensis]